MGKKGKKGKRDKQAELEKLEKLNPKSLGRIYKVFGRHYKKYWKTLAAASLFLFAGIAAEVLAPWPLKLILDHVVLDENFPRSLGFLNPLLDDDPKLLLLGLALAILLIAILEAFFTFFNKFLVSSTGDRINADIRERVFAHLQRLSLSFHETARSGNLVYLLTSDAKEMSSILIDFPQDLTHRLVTFATYTVIMFMMDWRLALIAISTVPLIYFFTRYFSRGMKEAMRKRRTQEGEVASIIVENVGAMALVQAYGREETEHARFSVENKGSLQAQIQAMRLHRLYSRITDALVIFATTGVLYFGGRYALGGEILPGTLVVFVAYLRDIYGSFEKFSGIFLGLAKSLVSGERLLELIENETVVKEDPKATPAPAFQGRIEFKNVSFAYKKGKEVLKDLNFVVEPGETVALAGHSGAGKSTLIGLLLRFYDPQRGQILFDGQDIRQFTLKSLRARMTIVLQEAMLFRLSVRENLAFGKVDATEEEIVAAAKLAEAHDFIMEMPEGYDTILYEGGDNLSGGQKQRLNIARALVRNTPLLILDEPATGLDAKAEAKVNAALHRLTRKRTTFIVAHKFSTIAAADKILLLEEGQLSHCGKHEQLLRESALYRELYEMHFNWQRELAQAEVPSSAGNGHAAASDAEVSA